MISKEKINKIFDLIESLEASPDMDRRVINSAKIMKLLVVNVDDLQEEVEHLREENEALRFDLEDKKFQEGPRRRGRSDAPARAVPSPRGGRIHTPFDPPPF